MSLLTSKHLSYTKGAYSNMNNGVLGSGWTPDNIITYEPINKILANDLSFLNVNKNEDILNDINTVMLSNEEINFVLQNTETDITQVDTQTVETIYTEFITLIAPIEPIVHTEISYVPRVLSIGILNDINTSYSVTDDVLIIEAIGQTDLTDLTLTNINDYVDTIYQTIGAE